MSDAIHRFGAFELLPHRQLLIHAGSPVTIGGRALAILSHLVEHAGSLVSREELLAAAWPNIFVHPGNLKVNVASLRRVLTAHDPRQDYIVSIPGRGYRFVAPVRRETAPNVTFTSAVRCASLPAVTSLVGRSDEVEAVCRELAASHFVTITGTGGVGKTAVALVAAHLVMENFAHGACFVDLASVTDERHLAATISSELGVRSDIDDLLGAVIYALGGEQRLLLLDNCEHLLPAIAAAAARLAAGLPHVTILATSREPMRLVQERVLRIAPLAYPSVDQAFPCLKDALAFPAVELFARRAREAMEHELRGADLPEVSEICRRLDGIPLALELAAARCAAQTPSTILGFLENRFELLDGSNSPRPARQRALRATLEWSYELLRPREAATLRALATFARAFTVDDALAMAQASGVAHAEALESVANLISKSLLSPDDRDNGVRYRLLESTRAFVIDRLQLDPHRNHLLQVHAEHVCRSLQIAQVQWQRATDAVESADPARWAADARQALAWAFGPNGSTSVGIRLTIAAIPMWESLSLLDESIANVSRALVLNKGTGSANEISEVELRIALATALLYARGLTAETEAAWRRALSSAEKTERIDLRMRGLWGCAAYDLHAGRPASTVERLQRFRRLSRRLADQSAAADGERLLAAAEMYLGRFRSATARLRRVPMSPVRKHQTAVQPSFQVHRDSAVGGTLAVLTWLSGDRVAASHLAEVTAENAISAGHPVSICNVLVLSSLPIAILDRRFEDARRHVALLEKLFVGGRLTLWNQMARCPDAALRVHLRESDGVTRLQQAIAGLRAAQATIRVPFYMGQLADALANTGRLAEATLTVDDALALAARQQERWVVPELHRIKAGVHLRCQKFAMAEASLETAVTEADKIGASSWLVRASADLAHLRNRRDHGLKILGDLGQTSVTR